VDTCSTCTRRTYCIGDPALCRDFECDTNEYYKYLLVQSCTNATNKIVRTVLTRETEDSLHLRVTVDDVLETELQQRIYDSALQLAVAKAKIDANYLENKRVVVELESTQ